MQILVLYFLQIAFMKIKFTAMLYDTFTYLHQLLKSNFEKKLGDRHRRASDDCGWTLGILSFNLVKSGMFYCREKNGK